MHSASVGSSGVALILHDATETRQRTHEAIDGSDLVVIDGGTHGINVSHAKEFNDALLEFLKK